MFKTMLIATLVLACASIAAGQSDYKRFEFFGGYSHNRIDTGIGDDDVDLDEYQVSDALRRTEFWSDFVDGDLTHGT